jgi:hypothetical protein
VEISKLLEQKAKEDLAVLIDYVPRVIKYYEKTKAEQTPQEISYVRDSFQRFLYLRFYLNEKELEDFNLCIGGLVGLLNDMNEKLKKEMRKKPNIQVVGG